MKEILVGSLKATCQELHETSGPRKLTLEDSTGKIERGNRPRTFAKMLREIADFFDSQPDRPGDERSWPAQPKIYAAQIGHYGAGLELDSLWSTREAAELRTAELSCSRAGNFDSGYHVTEHEINEPGP
jgi:hypothetical protein